MSCQSKPLGNPIKIGTGCAYSYEVSHCIIFCDFLLLILQLHYSTQQKFCALNFKFATAKWPRNVFVICYSQKLLISSINRLFFFVARQPPNGPRPPHYRGLIITLKHITKGRTSLDEWLVQRRNLYLTSHHIHNRQTFMPPAGFEPTIPGSERPQTHALDRAATGIDKWLLQRQCTLRALTFILDG